jgi:hypothetical protein
VSGEIKTVRVNVFAASRDDLTDFDTVDGPDSAGWPTIDSSEWASGLDRLVADISGRDMDEFSDHRLIFPDRAAGDWEGPWLVQVPSDVVDALALLRPDQISRYADRRALGEDQLTRALALSDLCRRALGEDRDVYQWSTE